MKRGFLFSLLLCFGLGCEKETVIDAPVSQTPETVDVVANLLVEDGWILETGIKWQGTRGEKESILVTKVKEDQLPGLSNIATTKRGSDILSVAVLSGENGFDPIESLRIAKLLSDDPMSLQIHEAKPENQSAAVDDLYKKAVADLKLPPAPSTVTGKPQRIAWTSAGERTYSIVSSTLNFPFIPVTKEGLERRTQTRAKIRVVSDKVNVTFSFDEVFARSSNETEFQKVPSDVKTEHPHTYKLDKLGAGVVEAFPLIDQLIKIGETVEYKTEVDLSIQGAKGPIRGVGKFTLVSSEPCKKKKGTCFVFTNSFDLTDMSDHPASVKESQVVGQGIYRFNTRRGEFESGENVIFYKMKAPKLPMIDSTDGYVLMQNSYSVD